jgi:hypothetical protein
MKHYDGYQACLDALQQRPQSSGLKVSHRLLQFIILFLEFIEGLPVANPFSYPNWIFETKLDG